MKRKCSICKIIKPLSQFYKDKLRKFGYGYCCKQCYNNYYIHNKKKLQKLQKNYYNENKKVINKKQKLYNIKNKEKIKKYTKKYRKENRNKIKRKKQQYYKKFPEKKILDSIKQRCNNKNLKIYKKYGKRGIKCLITEIEIRKLMIRDNYWDMKKPSIDRIDNNGHYTYNNCRFIELGENASRNKRKPILQFDLNGNFIKEWNSIREASRVLKIANSNISYCINGKYKQARGFIWKYN